MMAMKRRNVLVNFILYTGVSIVMVVAAYIVNVLLLSSNEKVSPTDAFFLEGVVTLCVSFLLFLGRGGLNLASMKAAILSAAADAVFSTETVGPSKEMRTDAWRSRGFIRAALICLITGIIMLAVYFLTL